MKNKVVNLISLLVAFLTLSQSDDALARWRDQGQSEKYFAFWEDKHQWEASAIEGYKLLLDQNYQQASANLKNAISLGCPLGKVQFQIGLCFDKLNQPEKAEQSYRSAIEIFSKPNEKNIDEYVFLSHYNLGVLLLEQGHDNEAVKEFESASSVRPEDAVTYVNLGYIYSRNDMTEKAVEAYKSAISHDPQFAVAHYNLGVLLRHLGRVEEGNLHIDEARSIDPTIQGLNKQVLESREVKDPMSLTPEEVLMIKEKAKGSENLTAVGNLYYARQEYENAVLMYDQALEENSDAVEAYVGKGQALLQLDQHEDAQRVIFKALELDPNNVNGHIQLGKLYYDSGRVQMARQEFEKVHDSNPNQVEVLFYLGVVNEYSGDTRYGEGFPAQEAIKYYLRVLEINPSHLKSRTNLGNVYARKGDWENAKKEFELASQKAANNAYAHYNLGYIYDELGLRRQSIEEYLMAIKLDPEFADAYFNLGYVYSEYKVFNLAERQYYRVLDIDKNYSDAYYNLGILYDRYIKDKVKAHTYYHEYALRMPNAPLGERKILKKRIIKLYP